MPPPARRATGRALAAVALLPLVLSGCPHHSAPAVPLFAACAVPAGGWAPDEDRAAYALRLAGPVLQAGDGDAPDGCFAVWEGFLGADLGAGADAFWLRMADGAGRAWIVGVEIPGLARPFDAGATAAVDLDLAVEHSLPGGPILRPGRVAPLALSGGLVLRDAAGATLAWIGDGYPGIDAALLPASVAIARGEVAYRRGDSCGKFQGYDADVTAGGQTVSVPYGETREVGPFVVLHGGLDEITDVALACRYSVFAFGRARFAGVAVP